MTDKELRKLSRVELLEMLLSQSKEIARLQDELKLANEKLNSREILIDNAGSIAEAALQVNDIFDVAQEAADQYLENIQSLSGRQKEISEKLEKESKARAVNLLETTKRQCQEMEVLTKDKCDRMLKKAEAESKAYCINVREQVSLYLKQRAKLQELLNNPFSEDFKF